MLDKDANDVCENILSVAPIWAVLNTQMLNVCAHSSWVDHDLTVIISFDGVELNMQDPSWGGEPGDQYAPLHSFYVQLFHNICLVIA